MNKWKALLPVVTAFAEGKVIQERNGCGDRWRDIQPGVTPTFFMEVENYRVKPEPREFYINLYKEHSSAESTYIHNSLAQATANKQVGGRTIKVREVVE